MPGKQAKVVTPPMLKRMLRRASRSSFPARDRAMILLSIKAGRSAMFRGPWLRDKGLVHLTQNQDPLGWRWSLTPAGADLLGRARAMGF